MSTLMGDAASYVDCGRGPKISWVVPLLCILSFLLLDGVGLIAGF